MIWLRYVSICIIFFFGVGPGVLLIGPSKYMMGLVPSIIIPLMIYLLKDEWIGTDWNRLIRNKGMYKDYALALQISIYAMALCTLLFRPEVSLTDQLTEQFPIMVFHVIVLGPIAEEIFYRRIIFGAFLGKLPFWAAAGVTSVIFGAAHLSWERFLGYAVVSWMMCWLYKKHGTLAPSILTHCSINFIAILATTLRS
ncbi:lysostaphin resistance A-like protein [Paenibacillus chartarius]|uniref:Lysostaphin resistance A-like protein n=1 Tax=Paenibacillus chartarius TaxID=747481 RepID=A0ABV6DQ37_9BACL